MPLFNRADWPRDHRDEVVAGALVGAVVIVLGYASGIGAPSSSGSAQAAVPPTSPPAATAPPSTAPAPGEDTPGGAAPAPQVPVGSGELPIGTGVVPIGDGGHAGHGTGTGTGSGSGGSGGGGHDGHGGDGTTPSTPTPAPSPSGSTGEEPSGDGSCDDGDVRLVRPLLTGISGLTGQALGLLGGTEPTPEPAPSLCVGIATPNLLSAPDASDTPDAAGATP
ncbi:hypothetical protein [Streptomyces sp. NBC_00878]|uniref:hypothetical protein n=1 Tax=Streptomyces sp. NBC_00878 TaxID=2975854 RepID=UPI00224FBF1A|nr:hypothetical protein [Streptomyces sp. NBC_00878]MCX4908188.1 hypothetical protein [Streptomyces sp. NBC_00878]